MRQGVHARRNRDPSAMPAMPAPPPPPPPQPPSPAPAGPAPSVRSLAATPNGARSALEAADADGEDTTVDFSNASLYLGGIQTVFAICACAVVSVLSCWAVPEGGVSAVRTLALCVATGALLMRKPLRVGRAHGVRIVFASLQPAVPLYLAALVVEQLVHTCTSDTAHAPSWRRVVFHGMILVMLAAGVMRARAPLLDTDMPFLLTASALLVIALMPPPAVALVGPLCQSVTVWEAADRLVRSFAFAGVYCAHVYALTANTSLTSSETMIVVTRSGSAALWTMGAHVAWLPAAIVQCGLVITARISIENGGAYRALPAGASDDEDVERGRGRAAASAASSPKGPSPLPHPSQHAHHQHALLQALEQEASPVDVLQQQRELLAQPSAVSLAFPSSSSSGPPPCAHSRRSPSPYGDGDPNETAGASSAAAGAPTTLPADPAFGPRSFREVVVPADAQAAAAPPPMAPLPAARPASGGGPMTAARMAEIAASIPDDEGVAPDAGRGS